MAKHSRAVDLTLPPQFDGRNVLAYLRSRHVEPLEAIGPRSFARPIWHGSHSVIVRIAFHGHRLSQARAWLPRALRTSSGRTAVLRLTGADRDTSAFASLARRDPLLGPLVRSIGWLGIPQLPDLYEALVRAILEQQISLKAAATVTRRFLRRFGRPLRSEQTEFVAFPRPSDVLAARDGDIRGVGLTGAKEGAIIAASELAAAGALNAETPVDELPGVGPWTAGCVRMRALGDSDVFLERDLGVRVALARLLERDEPVTPQEASELAERWTPWRSHATVYLWESLTTPTAKSG